MGYVILEHVHDHDSKVYRVLVAWEEQVEVVKLDENGLPIGTAPELAPDEHQAEGGVGPTEFETVMEKVHSNVHDYVFDADDPRYEGKSRKQIAAMQRKVIADAIVERESKEAEEPALAEMPGVGEPLKF